MGEQIREENKRTVTEGEAKRLLHEAEQRQQASEAAGRVATQTEAGEKLKEDIDSILDEEELPYTGPPTQELSLEDIRHLLDDYFGS